MCCRHTAAEVKKDSEWKHGELLGKSYQNDHNLFSMRVASERVSALSEQIVQKL